MYRKQIINLYSRTFEKWDNIYFKRVKFFMLEYNRSEYPVAIEIRSQKFDFGTVRTAKSIYGSFGENKLENN